MAQHANSYKLLFTHPEMVRDLLTEYAPGPWQQEVDFSTLELVSGSYVSDDIIWRMRLRDQWVYVYLLLEFQSTVDYFMAVRIMVYLGLLYQDLIRSQDLKTGDLLPPVLPLVLYRGERAWNAPVDVADLIVQAPAGLEPFRPRLQYLLLEERNYPRPDLDAPRNLVSALFRLENSRSEGDVLDVFQKLAEWFTAPEQRSLVRAFSVWFQRVWVPSRAPNLAGPPVQDLAEINTMLEERIKEWTTRWEQQGTAKALVVLLEKRFGPLPESARNRVLKADEPTLMIWLPRVLDADSIDNVIS